MTNAQRLRVLGHNTSLAQRGVVLLFPNGKRAVGIVEIVPPPAEERVLGEASRNAVRVHVLRSTGMTADLGQSISNTESGASYRVTNPDVSPDNPICVWECEAS